MIFVNNWLNPERNSDKAWLKTEVLIEANTTNSANYANFPNPNDNDQFRFREAFVRGGNFFASQPEAKFWAGERYYRRQHIEIDDFYPLDMSGYGAGVEDLKVRHRQACRSRTWPARDPTSRPRAAATSRATSTCVSMT